MVGLGKSPTVEQPRARATCARQTVIASRADLNYADEIGQYLHKPQILLLTWYVKVRPGSDRHSERGAAAVEFALVSSLLFTIMFGVIQYGLFFNDALSTRQGVREGTRQGVVRNFAPCGTESTDMGRLKCNTRLQIDAVTGTEYVKVVRPLTWAKTQPLIVCAMVKSDGALGLLPMPNGGWIGYRIQMSIEQDATPLPTGASTSDPLPAGVTYPC